MKKVFELLKKRGIRRVGDIEKYIMGKFQFKDILDLNNQLLETIQVADSAPEDLALFNFTANSNMTAQHNSCPVWDCRLRRVEETARFAALYCDRLYVRNYFEAYGGEVCTARLEPAEEFRMRYQYAGDLKILFLLKPLLEARIVQFTKTRYHLCPSCAQRIIPRSLLHEIGGVVDMLSEEYLKMCKAKMVKEKELPSPYNVYLQVEGVGSLCETNRMARLSDDLPKWLLRRSGLLKARSRKRVYRLTKDDMRRIGIPKGMLEDIATDVIFQHLLSQFMNTKYLSDRDADRQLLSSLSVGAELQEYNELLSTEFVCKMPLIQDVPLKDILRLRQKEFESFLLFRNKLGGIITDHLCQQKRLTKREGRALFKDVLYPELCKLESTARNLKKSAIFKNARDLVVTTGLLSMGLCAGVLPHDAKLLIGAVGGFHLSRELINSLTAALRTPEEIRNHNLFFLWKLSQKRLHV